jgi:hypothetical protein
MKRAGVSSILVRCFFGVLVLAAASAFSRLHVMPTTSRPLSVAAVAPHDKKPDTFKITSENLKELTVHSGPSSALSALTLLVKTDPAVGGICHDLTHVIGQAAYETYGFDKALTFDSPLCGSGYLHGVIEKRFAGIPLAKLPPLLQEICRMDDGRCLHGVGHGVMFATDNKMPFALRYCSSFPTATAQSFCSEGVFMENFSTEDSSHPSAYRHPDDPFYPCAEQKVRYEGTCYFYSVSYYLKLHANDYRGAFSWCMTARMGYIGTCMSGVGSRAMKYTIGDTSYVEKICDSAPADFVNSCIDGMVSYYLVNANTLQAGASLCATFKPEDTKQCVGSVNVRKGWFTTD